MKRLISPQSLFFPNPVFVVGSYDADGRANAITLAWGGVASSNPPSISIAVRPSRYSYRNIMERKAFTINLPGIDQVKQADYFGLVSGKNVDKFKAVGLTAIKADEVDAPLIAEFPYNMECALTHSLDLGSHTLFIGEVKQIHAEEQLLDENGDLRFGNSILTFDSGTRCYRAPGEVVSQAFHVGLEFADRD